MLVISKKTFFTVGGIVFMIIVLMIYSFLFAPLFTQLKTKYLEYKKYQEDISYARDLIASVKLIWKRHPILTEKEISFAINELTKIGRSKGVDIVSIVPEKEEKTKESQYKILPISLEIESTYEQLGNFLGALDELEKSLVTLRSFKTTPYSKENSTILKTKLVVDMYLLGDKYAE